MMRAIQEKGLQAFYPSNSPMLDQVASRAPQQIDRLCSAWRINREIAQDVVKLALYDIILYVDDSGSMAFEEGGERIKDLRLVLERVAFAASLFDDDGIEVRFMNSLSQGNNIRNEQQAAQLIAEPFRFQSLTPMGTELDNKILQPLVLAKARSGTLRKPVLIITITDGQPAGEKPPNSSTKIFEVIKQASMALSQTRYGKGAVAYQFAQVGNDLKAREFLGRLDEDPIVGELVDCTSSTYYWIL